VGLVALLPLYWLAPPAPPVSWLAMLHAAPTVLLALVPCAALVGFGFSLHRGRVGSW